METNHLIIVILIITAFYINYVATIHCYVCNSYENEECAQIPKEGPETSDKFVNSFYKDCEQELADRLQLYLNISLDSNCELCEAYSSGQRYKQCRFTILSLTDDNGEEEERVFRECAGLFNTSNGCYEITTKTIKTGVCVCGSDGCNSSHKRIHQNIYSNLLLSIIICLNFYLNY